MFRMILAQQEVWDELNTEMKAKEEKEEEKWEKGGTCGENKRKKKKRRTDRRKIRNGRKTSWKGLKFKIGFNEELSSKKK